MKKKLISLFLVFAMCLSMLPMSAVATGETTADVAYVTIANMIDTAATGGLVLIRYPVTVTENMTIHDALMKAHNENDMTGGYSSYEGTETEGRWIDKLWGVDTTFVGFTLNRTEEPDSASEPITAGEELYAWIYRYTETDDNVWGCFDKTTATCTAGGSVDVTLMPAAAVENGANVYVYKMQSNGYKKDSTTEQVMTDIFDEQGKATVTFSEAGTYVITAKEKDTGNDSRSDSLIAPYCVVTVKEAPAPATYDITVSESANGTVTADKDEAEEGETVTLTVTPAEGYELESLTYTPEDGEAVDITEAKSFTMPASAVTVSASFNVVVPEVKETRIDMSGLASSLMANWGCFGALIIEGVEVVDYSEWTGAGAFGKYQANITVYVASEDANGTATIHVEAAENETFTASGELVTGTKSTTLVDGVGTITGAVTSVRSNGSNNFKVNVTFAPAPTQEPTGYAVAVNDAENGTVTANKATAAEGETVTLTVTPAEGYELDTLTAGELELTKVNDTTYTFVMPASAVTVSASFKLKPVYAVTVNDATNGTVTADKATAAEGETVTLTVTPSKGYGLETLTVDGADVTAKVSGGKYTFTMPAKAVEVSATFVEDPYPYRMNLKISGYEIGKVAKYASVKMYDTNGTDVTAGEWYCCVVDSNEGNNWNIGELKANTRYWLRIERYISGYQASDFGLLDMEAVSVTDSSASGNFLIYIELPMLEAPAPATYGITVNTAENGTVTADKAEAAEGETITLTVAPAEGYELDTLTAGELELTKVNDTTYTFVMPASAVTVSASFKLLPVTYEVTVSEMLGGTVTADKTKAAEGETVTLTVAAAQYYELDSLTVTDADDAAVTVTDNTFTMPASAVTVSATFKQTSGMQQYFTVTVDGVEYPAQYIGVQYYDEKGRDCEAFQVNLPEGATSMTVACDYKLYVLDMTNTTIAYKYTSYSLPLNGAVTIYKLNSNLGGNSSNYCYLRAVLPSYGVTVNAGENGKVEADKTVAAKGETVTLTVTPDDGYMVDTLNVTDAEGKTIEVAEDNTFAMPGSAVTVTVTFKEVPPVYYKVTIEASQNGTVSADKETAILNDTVKLTVTPADGYTLKSLTVTTVDGAAIEVAEDNTFKMPAADVKVTATFKAGSTAKVTIKLEGYELGKKGNQVKATMTLANGGTFSSDYWYIHTATDMNSFYKGELMADTTYWLCVQTGSTSYKASDFALEDMEIVSVVDKSDSYQLFFFIELPQLNAPAVSYAIDTSKVVDGTVTAKVGGNTVTEATAGSTVTLTAAPNEGFTLGELIVQDAAGTAINVTNIGENTYIFVMPESAVQINTLFRQVEVEGKSTVALGEAKDVLAGDKIIIPVNVANAPSGNYYQFNLGLILPDGWKIIDALEGADCRLNSTDVWMPTPTGSSYGLIAMYDGNAGVRFPNGEVMKLVIQIPTDATPGIYKLDTVSAGLTMGQVDSETSSFDQYIDGHIIVKAGPTEKTKLDTPAITEGMILAWEDMVESRNVPQCQQDVNAIVEYRLAETQEALESAEWILGTEPDNYTLVYTDTIRWIKDELKANTKYYLQVRYRAYNTNYFIDSDPYTTDFTTKAWIEDPVKIITNAANACPGDTFTVAMNFEHAFDNQAFIDKEYDFTFNDEYFTLESINWNSDILSGNKLPEGDVAELTFRVKDDVEAGEYDLELTSTKPFTLRYNRDGSGYYKHNREYPVNHEFASGKITVLARLEAPVLSGYTATDDSITVTPPATVEGATIQYAISTKADETSFSWQESNVFTGLDEKTTYYVYARYVVPAGSTVANSVASATLKVKTVNPTVTYTVGSAEAEAGATVDVAVTLTHEIVKQATSFRIIPTVAEGLTLQSANAGTDLPEGWKVMLTDGVVTVYRTDAADVPSGAIVILTFAVAETVEEGDLAISLTAGFSEDTNCFIGADSETVLRIDGTVTAGKITVKSIVYGDITKDGSVEGNDLASLRRYLAGWSKYNAETLDLDAADVNTDAQISMTDAIILSRHFVAVDDPASWQDYKNLPFVKK